MPSAQPVRQQSRTSGTKRRARCAPATCAKRCHRGCAHLSGFSGRASRRTIVSSRDSTGRASQGNRIFRAKSREPWATAEGEPPGRQRTQKPLVLFLWAAVRRSGSPPLHARIPGPSALFETSAFRRAPPSPLSRTSSYTSEPGTHPVDARTSVGTRRSIRRAQAKGATEDPWPAEWIGRCVERGTHPVDARTSVGTRRSIRRARHGRGR